MNSKTMLQEYSLKKFKQLPKYTFYKKKGPEHSPTFQTDVQIPNSKKNNWSRNFKKKCTTKMQQKTTSVS